MADPHRLGVGRGAAANPEPTFPLPSNRPVTLLTPREAAAALRVSERTLWGLADRGDLRAVRIGRAVRYDAADLRAFVEQAKGRVRM